MSDSHSQVEEVKAKINIVDIIGEHVKLNKSGSNFKGLCPFHKEKSPSFMVSEDLQIYKCFGCGEGGDVFTFLEKYEGMDFGESLRFLAEKAGITLKQGKGIESSDKDILFDLNALAAKFYNYILLNHPVGKVALNYLKADRKITEESIKTFNIGYAPARKNSLSDYLIHKKKFNPKDLEKAGLVYITKFGKVYDRFEGRIIFPISDQRGNVRALAGRLLPPGRKDAGKYINSPETSVYHKSSSLYGINISKEFIKKTGFAVVVEGEIDLISSYQIDIKNVVAIKGSAFTEDQARLLARYTKEITLALDTDFAGIEASIRGIKILERLDFEIKVIKLGKYKDPDEAAKANPQFYKDQLENAVPVWDFVIDSAIDRFGKDTVSSKTKLSKFLVPLLSQINNKIIQEHYIRKLSKLLEVSEEAVMTEIDKSPSEVEKQPEVVETTTKKTNHELREELLISHILKKSPNLLKDERIINLITTPVLRRLLEEFDPKDPSGKSLPKELFDKFGELSLKIDVGEVTEINSMFKLLSMEATKKAYQTSTDPEKSKELQQKYKDFDSDQFEGII